MTVFYAKDAVKSINRLDAPTRQRIRQAVNGIPRGDIKPLQGTSDTFRLRVGDWRILFSYPDDDTILVERVAPRGDVYKGV